MKGPGPTDWAHFASRKLSYRHQRRAAEALVRKDMEGKSVPQLKKQLRRKKK